MSGTHGKEREGTSTCLLRARHLGCLELSSQPRKNWIERSRVLHREVMHQLREAGDGERLTFSFEALSGLVRLYIFKQEPKMGAQWQDEQSLLPREAWAVHEERMSDTRRQVSALLLKVPRVESLSCTRYCP